MALEIEQKQGGSSWEPLFSGAPTPDERRKREDPKVVGEGFVSAMPQILLLRNISRALTPVKTVVTIVTKYLKPGLRDLFSTRSRIFGQPRRKGLKRKRVGKKFSVSSTQAAI